MARATRSAMVSASRFRAMAELLRAYRRSHKSDCLCNECVLATALLEPSRLLSRSSFVLASDQFEASLSAVCYELEDSPQHNGRPRHYIADVLFGLVLRAAKNCSYRALMPLLGGAAKKGFIVNVPHYNSLNAYARSSSTRPYLNTLYEAVSGDKLNVNLGVEEMCLAVANAIYARPLCQRPPEPTTEPILIEDAASLIRLIDNLIPRVLKAEQREEVSQEIILAILSGHLSSDPETIRKRVQKFVRENNKTRANKFRDISIDAPLGDADLTIADSLVG